MYSYSNSDGYYFVKTCKPQLLDEWEGGYTLSLIHCARDENPDLRLLLTD